MSKNKANSIGQFYEAIKESLSDLLGSSLFKDTSQSHPIGHSGGVVSSRSVILGRQGPEAVLPRHKSPDSPERGSENGAVIDLDIDFEDKRYRPVATVSLVNLANGDEKTVKVIYRE